MIFINYAFKYVYLQHSISLTLKYVATSEYTNVTRRVRTTYVPA